MGDDCNGQRAVMLWDCREYDPLYGRRFPDRHDRVVIVVWCSVVGAARAERRGHACCDKSGNLGEPDVIGFVLTSAAFILIFWLIPRIGATSASSITLIAPISSIWLGVVFLNEELLFVQGVGMAVIFAGLLCIDGRILRLARKAQPSG